MKMYVGIDEGTTNVKVGVFDDDFNMIKMWKKGLETYYPREGWVEQDAEKIIDTVYILISHLKNWLAGKKIDGVGIANQRETTIVWNKKTGKPIYNAIVWQCRRTANMLREIKDEYEKEIREKTGLEVDPYFSASKISWILKNVKNAREMAERGALLFGTVDTYLIWKLTNGKVHATDHTNASRTMLYNINKGVWDDELLEIFNIPESMLPEIRDSGGDYGQIDILNSEITGVLGDQQSALLAHGCVNPGDMKVTYGTGTFLLENTGEEPLKNKGLLTTVAWSIKKRTFAQEGSILSSGTVVEWLKENGLWSEDIGDETELYFVPAFSGLGSPYWDPDARGMLIGITPYTKKEHIARAAMESIGYMVRDVVEMMDINRIGNIHADGGMTKNRFLMQFQADIIGKKIIVPRIKEMTVRGAAIIGAIGNNKIDVKDVPKVREFEAFSPVKDKAWRKSRYNLWKEAVRRSMGWFRGK